MEQIERKLPPVIEADGTVNYHSVTSPSDNSIAVCEMVPNRIIPVIFVPGIMGSNLSRRSDNAPIWRLDNKLSIRLNWSTKDAQERKALLDPNETQVDGAGKIPSGTKLSQAELRRRGWGEVSYINYGGFLVWLENALDDASFAKMGLRASLMSRLVADDPNVQPLTYNEVAQSYKYLFPVHAMGYNWLQSNVASACRLDERVNEILGYYQDLGKRCEYVILVTHSMGGFVARYYTMCLRTGERSNASVAQAPVLGVVHAAMPDEGAAAVYKRMKTGTEGFLIGPVLGESAAEVTPVFAQSPGILELLPSPDYGRGWLKIKSQNKSAHLPESRNVYDEIYTVRDNWWGMCESFRINPLDNKKKYIDRDWADYVKIIRLVEKFHSNLSGKYHPNTYAFYGNDQTKKAWGDVVWQRFSVDRRRYIPGPDPDDLTAGEVVMNFGGTGRRLMQIANGTTITTHYELQTANESGDGTVPVRSGRGPTGFVKVCIGYKNFDHSKAFEGESQRLFALWSITKIAYSIRETSMGYEDK